MAFREIFLLQTFSASIKNFVYNYLSMNVWTFLVHLLCAVLILICISVWVWKPTNDFIDRQRKKLDKERRDLVMHNRETKYFLTLLRKERNEIFNTKKDIKLKAMKEAEFIKSNARAFIEKYTSDRRKEADARIKMLEDQAKKEIKNSVVNMAVELTEKLVAANMNEATNKAIIDEYIKDLEEKKL